jgi:ArsR family transcriptional regulator
MKKKPESCCESPVQDDDPVPELPEQVRDELDARGGMKTLARQVPPRKKLEERSRIYQALSDPIRLSILYIIREQPLCVCVIKQFMQLSGSKLSYHLTSLKEAGLIDGKYQGNWIIYSITDRGRRLLQCTEHAGK